MPTTGTSSPFATTRCFCSLSTGTAWPRRCGQATCIAPTTGTTSSCRRLTGSRRWARAWRSAQTPRSRSLRSTTRSSTATWTMPSACRRTRSWSWRSRTFCFVRRDGRAASPWCATRVSAIRRRAGPRPGRIVAKVEHHRGELFPRVGFIVTNMDLPSRSVVRFYNKCGTAEQWIKEGKPGDALDAAVVPSFPGERSAPATERPGVQPGQPLAQDWSCRRGSSAGRSPVSSSGW